MLYEHALTPADIHFQSGMPTSVCVTNVQALQGQTMQVPTPGASEVKLRHSRAPTLKLQVFRCFIDLQHVWYAQRGNLIIGPSHQCKMILTVRGPGTRLHRKESAIESVLPMLATPLTFSQVATCMGGHVDAPDA